MQYSYCQFCKFRTDLRKDICLTCGHLIPKKRQEVTTPEVFEKEETQISQLAKSRNHLELVKAQIFNFKN